MKTIISILLVSWFISTDNAPKYYVYKQTMSCVCKIQLETERPLFGAQHLGPFNTR